MDVHKRNRSKHKPYQCCRCGYETHRKPAMRQHLYGLKKHCPATTNDIELTDAIKDYIMANRVYHIPKAPKTPAPPINQFNQQINNTNVIQNYVASMDVVEKLEKYMAYNNTSINSFEKTIEDRYNKKSRYLERDQGLNLSTEDLIGIVDKVSVAKDPSDFNIMYDKRIGKIMFYDTGEWDEMMTAPGIKRLIENVQEYYLNGYESFLLRKLVNPNTHFQERHDAMEHIKQYYRFLACFGIFPYVHDRSDREVLYYFKIGEGEDELLEDRSDVTNEYLNVYAKQRKSVTETDKKRMAAQVIDILKKNTTKNTGELNKKIVALCNMQEDFKHFLSGIGINGV